MRAVLKTGGKQYRVAVNDTLSVEKISESVGKRIDLGPPLLLQNHDELITEAQTLQSTQIICEVMRQGRNKKVVVFKKKRRKNYRKTQGHRQSFTLIKVVDIITENTEKVENGT